MSNELTDVRCPCGDEYPADSYDAGFIAGSGMCQNCDAALPPKDICTCPSGDGSLRHPCPAHPASVELAGVGAKLTFINGRPAMCGCQVEYSSGGGEYSDVIDVTLCAKHSGSAILDLVATNRIALTPEYEGQWHADLYLDREIPLAKAEGATPAEAVLALMSAERIDPEQESVEQAGGDERDLQAEGAQGERRIAISEESWGTSVHLGTGTFTVEEVNRAVQDHRAGLTQPSPVRSSLLINGYQLRAALDFIAPDGTAEQLKSEACIEWRQQDADFLEAGLYAFCAEYPEEGGVLLDEEPTTAQPSPLQSEQAEAERPEVVARVVHSNPVVLGQCGPLNANDELMTVAQHAASVARWAEMFNRVEQERDVALARVAELERQEPVDVPGPDEIHQMAFEEGQPAEDGDGYLFSAEEFDLFVQRLLDSCATPVAWAQHSVPEGWRIERSAERIVVMNLKNGAGYAAARDGESGIAESVLYLLAADLLAAAPGKDGV